MFNANAVCICLVIKKYISYAVNFVFALEKGARIWYNVYDIFCSWIYPQKRGIMNVEYLKYVIAVANAGSLCKAAEELYMAQPNLSRIIKKTEKELDIVIFERTSKGVSLTPDGERLVECGKKILKQIDDVDKLFKEKKGKKAILAVSAPRADYISHAFAEFSKNLSKEERCEIYYEETNALHAISNITEKGYKLGVIRYADKFDKYFADLLASKNLACELISEFKFVVLTSKDSPLTDLDEVRYLDLTNYIEILYADAFVPSVSLDDAQKEDLPDDVDRKIFVLERAGRFDVLSANTETFMWASPVSQEVLNRYNLVQIDCPDNKITCRDVLIYPADYKLTATDRAFITELCAAKRKFIDKRD